jgi:hypothetical protein
MWGTAIVGFGSYHYKYDSGREGDAPLAGIASRANGIVLYISCKFENSDALLKKFGKYKMSGGCIYIRQLADINPGVLTTLVKKGIAQKKKEYPA